MTEITMALIMYALWRVEGKMIEAKIEEQKLRQ